MNELTIMKVNGGSYIDSRDVADVIGKRHHNLLRDINSYIKIMCSLGAINFDYSEFFVAATYQSEQNKAMPCFLLSKMGCEMVANKLTGEKGVLFTAAYVKKFNEMEIAERDAAIKAHEKPRLNEFNSAVRNVLNGLNYCCAAPKRIISFLNGVYKQIGIEVCDTDDYIYDFYSVTDIARLLKVYSKNGRPHGHAVSAIIAKLNVSEAQTIIVPYGLVGLMVKYDWLVFQAVRDWFEENSKPRAIPHLNFKYHVYYERQTSLFDSDDDDFIDLDDDDCANFNEDELDKLCVIFDNCDICPGRHVCCEED